MSYSAGARAFAVAITWAVTSLAAPALQINEGATYSTKPVVTLGLTDVDAFSSMCISNTTVCKVFTPIEDTRSWTLVGGVGKRTVRVFLKSDSETIVVSDDILLDGAAPAGGRLVATYGDGINTLAWSGFKDVGSGIATYKLVGGSGAAAPACTAAALYEGPLPSYVHAGLVNGVKYSYRICASDQAGNRSTGAGTTLVASAIPRPESDAPTGTVIINGGAARTRSARVSLAITAADASTVTRMCLSHTTTCTQWVAYAPSRSFDLGGSDGVRTVRLWLEDRYTNRSRSPVASDTIILDRKPPRAGSVAVTACNRGLGLSWNGFSDQFSPVTNYRVVVAPGRTAPSCRRPPSYSGSNLAYTRTGLTNGVQYGYAVCASDQLGNMMITGKGGSARPVAGVTCPVVTGTGTTTATSTSISTGTGTGTNTSPDTSTETATATATATGTGAGTDTGTGSSLLSCQWSEVAHYSLTSLPSDAVTKNGCYLDQSIQTVGGRTAFQQRSDWNQAYTPSLFDTSFDGAAVEADVFIPAHNSHRGIGLALQNSPATTNWSCFQNDTIRGVDAGFSCASSTSTARWGASQKASNSDRTICCSTGSPAQTLVDNLSTGLSCSSLTNRWIKVRLEASRRKGLARFVVDGVELGTFSTTFDPAGTRVRFDSGAPSYNSCGVAWSNLKVYRGTCN